MTYLLPTTNNTIPVTGLINNNVTSSGSFTLSNIGLKEVNLTINVSGTVTGTNPTLTFTLAEIDPGNTSTTVGTSVVGAAIAATGTQTLKLADTTTGAIKVTWTIGGTATPTFNGVYATITLKNTEDVIEQFIPAAEDNTNGVIAQAIKPLASATYAPSYAYGSGGGFTGTTYYTAKASAGNIFSITAGNTTSTTSYVLIYNQATGAPSGSTNLVLSFPIPAQSVVTNNIIGFLKLGTETFTQSGINLSTGITFAISTTGSSFTAGTAANYTWSIVYI